MKYKFLKFNPDVPIVNIYTSWVVTSKKLGEFRSEIRVGAVDNDSDYLTIQSVGTALKS